MTSADYTNSTIQESAQEFLLALYSNYVVYLSYTVSKI